MADEEETKALLARAIELCLYGSEDANAHPIGCLSRDYNGIGPEAFPERLRRYVDGLTPELKPAALIHDFRWSHSDGSVEAFEYSNTELEMNCSKIAKSYPFWNPKRYYLSYVGRTFAGLCMRFGYIPFMLAYSNKNKEVSI